MPLRHATAEVVTRGLDLTNKVVLITGITSGIGKEAARVFALRNATVLGTGRTLEACKDSCLDFGERGVPFQCELSDPASVRGFVQDIRKRGQQLDVIVANAGIMASPKCGLLFGVEQQFYINHVSHYVIVNNLLDMLAPNGRVVIVSSDLHKQVSANGIDYDALNCTEKYDPLKSYAASKFANVAYSRALARKFEGTEKQSFAIHPGVIYTNLLRYQNLLVRSVASAMGKYLFKSVEQGASTLCYAAVHPEVSAPHTGYLENCREMMIHPAANRRDVQEKLIFETEKIAVRG